MFDTHLNTRLYIILGSKIWNNLPYYVKSSENLDTFKNLLKIGMEACVSVIYVKSNIFHTQDYLFCLLLLNIKYTQKFL